MSDLSVLGSRLLLAVIFFLAGVGKLLSPTPREYEIVNVERLHIRVLIRLMPFLEIGLSGALLFGRWPLVSAVVSSSFLLIFTLILLNAYKQPQQKGCSCFGYREGERITREQITFNILLMVPALLLVLAREGSAVSPIWHLKTEEWLAAALIAMPFLGARLLLAEASRWNSIR
jgi:uncharacterized membrane protein YphA (DoxX/SURF4 family)